MKKEFILFILIAISLSACGTYSFTGASTPEGIKTVSIQNFTNKAANAPAFTDRLFTELLKQKLVSESNLTFINKNGDYDFSGYIESYGSAPAVSTGGTFTNLYRLNMSVHVFFVNNKNPEIKWEKSFPYYADYDNTTPLTSVEQGLVTQISTRLTEDIFKAAFVNW